MLDGIKEQNIINGINAAELLGVVETIAQQPELAKMQFRAQNKWIQGTHNRTTIKEVYGAGEEQNREKSFVLDKDEPAFLLGTDQGANPVEHLLAALAGCLTTTLIYFAALEDIKLDEVTSKVEADASALGILGLDPNTRMGCEEIRVTFDIKSDEPKERIRELLELAQSRSGVFDALTNKTLVLVQLAS